MLKYFRLFRVWSLQRSGNGTQSARKGHVRIGVDDATSSAIQRNHLGCGVSKVCGPLSLSFHISFSFSQFSHVKYRFLFRSMLSAAHVLAMDAKNLLDVVDSIRIRYPELFLRAQLNPAPPIDNVASTQQIPIGRGQMPQPDASVESYEMMQRQTYQNLSEIADQSASMATLETDGTPEDLYANQQQLDQQCIYDNDCVISAQLNKLNMSNDVTSYASAVDSVVAPKLSPLPPAKPPVAAKPVNLQQKLKANLSSAATASTTSTHTNDNNAVTEAPNSAEDSLKIVEQEQDLYSNTKATE